MSASQFPVMLRDNNNEVVQNSAFTLAFRGDYTGTNLIYKGFAQVSAADEGASVWQISKQSYDGSGNLLTVKWPELPNGVASNAFKFSWTNRSTYTFV